MSKEMEAIINETVRFVLSHYEKGPMPFSHEKIEPDEWMGQMQIAPSPKLLPRSAEYFEARIKRWQELARDHLDRGEIA
jgi:peptidoglycan/xylan/chitin deacetylase (PgdA/CDA1 family)